MIDSNNFEKRAHSRGKAAEVDRKWQDGEISIWAFDEFLRTEGLFEDVTTLAWKRVLSWEVAKAMNRKGIGKSEMAKRMGTVQKAASAVGMRLTIESTDAPRAV